MSNKIIDKEKKTRYVLKEKQKLELTLKRKNGVLNKVIARNNELRD